MANLRLFMPQATMREMDRLQVVESRSLAILAAGLAMAQ